MNRIGVMQGRLTNKGGFYPQDFPSQGWKKEFQTAAEIGMDSIEWMFNEEDWKINPVLLDEKMEEIYQLIERTGVSISSICANYFMKNSIYSEERKEVERNIRILEKLMENAKKIRCRNIIIPMFEASELEEPDKPLPYVIKKLLQQIGNDINILLESNLEANLLKEYIQRYDSSQMGVCFDLGNIAGLGRRPETEVQELGSLIKNVHIKDKKISGSSVMLGEGDVDFEKCLHQLSEIGYDGYYILESYYNTDAVNDTIKNYNFIKGTGNI